jgi:hypothetical protein
MNPTRAHLVFRPRPPTSTATPTFISTIYFGLQSNVLIDTQDIAVSRTVDLSFNTGTHITWQETTGLVRVIGLMVPSHE